ncbi:MAG: histidinol-phosphatase [Bacilli bacterium]|jgi:histidinol-phosphatase (PHP family)
MLTANYHTHTKRCGHATGEDEDYVLEALGAGYHDLGFSDHVMLPGFSEPFVRGDYSQFQDYVDSINALKLKYHDRLTIYLGMEAESFPCYYPYYKELITNGVIDYLILGNHSAMNEEHKIYSKFSHISSPSQLYLYKDLAIQAISTGLFSIFAHPDYFMSSIEDFDSDCKKISKEIIQACIAYDVPLEINIGGIRNGKKQIGNASRWVYPTDDFFSLASKMKAKCIFGQDAHAPDQLDNETAIFQAVQFAKRHHLNVIDVLDKIKQH